MNGTEKLLAIALLCVACAVAANAWSGRGSAGWRHWGADLHNTRSQPDEWRINRFNASRLEKKWETQLGGELSATPAVEGDAVYMTDLGGGLTRLSARTGEVIWSKQVAEYTEIPGSLARATPAIAGDLLIFGDQGGRLGVGARVMAVNKHTGALAWITLVDAHPAALITASAVVHDGTAYVGVSSAEESYTIAVPGYVCCSFVGSMVALDVASGEVRWQTPMIDEPAYAAGYRGNAIWGSSPVVDTKRGALYVTTGNNYALPEAVSACLREVLELDPQNEEATRACLGDDGNYFDAFVALDLDDGDVRWWTSTLPFDAYTVVCVSNPEDPNCPSPRGPDYDFGQSPMLFSVRRWGSWLRRDLLGAGQKSGIFWALDPDDGDVVWSTAVGPGGPVGGSQWGSATDGKRIYVAVANVLREPWELQRDGAPTGVTTNQGLWSALDPRTGRILWQTAEPNPEPEVEQRFIGNWAMGPLSVANGVVYAGSMAPDPTKPNMFALSAVTGRIRWEFASGASVVAGAAVLDGSLYWPSGYSGLNTGTTGRTLYAFELPPRRARAAQPPLQASEAAEQ